MSRIWSQAQYMQDPVRLTLVGASPTRTAAAALGPAIIFNVNSGGDMTISNESGATILNLNTSNAMWWGQVGSYAVTGAGNRRFPGTFWETMVELTSGFFSQVPLSSGLFVRVSDLPNYRYAVNAIPGTVETGNVRISWRRWTTTTTLGTADFPTTIIAT